MDVHIGEMQSEVRLVDDRSVLSPEVLARVIEATLAELERRRAGEQQAHSDTRLWHSVRAGSGR
jgi:hypothetical protein